MLLHDAVLDTATLTKSRSFWLVFSEVAGGPEGTTLTLCVTGAQR